MALPTRMFCSRSRKFVGGQNRRRKLFVLEHSLRRLHVIVKKRLSLWAVCYYNLVPNKWGKCPGNEVDITSKWISYERWLRYFFPTRLRCHLSRTRQRSKVPPSTFRHWAHVCGMKNIHFTVPTRQSAGTIRLSIAATLSTLLRHWSHYRDQNTT